MFLLITFILGGKWDIFKSNIISLRSFDLDNFLLLCHAYAQVQPDLLSQA